MTVTLTVERVGYLGKPVSVPYATQQSRAAEQIGGVTVYNALEGADYQLTSGAKEFSAGQVSYFGSYIIIISKIMLLHV